MSNSFLKIQSLKRIPTPLETHEQQNFVKFARFMLRAKDLDQLVFSIPNEGARNNKNHSRMIAEGMVSGVPDLFIAIPSGGFHGLFIEMKRQKQSSVSEKQRVMIDLLKLQNYRVEVCKGFDEARNAFLDYFKNSGLLRKIV